MIWVGLNAARAIHTRLLAEHGGIQGERDVGAIESALARPQNMAAYGGDCDLFDLAAAYAFGLARNHGFVDGNKRTAYAVANAFLVANGKHPRHRQADVVLTVGLIAVGEMSEAQIAAWLRKGL